MRYAIVNTADEVVNVIELELNADFKPPKDHKLVANRDWPATPSPALLPLDPAIARNATFKADAQRQDMVDRLKTATPAQIKNFVQTNVTDLASAKTLITQLMLALATIVKE